MIISTANFWAITEQIKRLLQKLLWACKQAGTISLYQTSPKYGLFKHAFWVSNVLRDLLGIGPGPFVNVFSQEDLSGIKDT